MAGNTFATPIITWHHSRSAGAIPKFNRPIRNIMQNRLNLISFEFDCPKYRNFNVSETASPAPSNDAVDKWFNSAAVRALIFPKNTGQILYKKRLYTIAKSPMLRTKQRFEIRQLRQNQLDQKLIRKSNAHHGHSINNTKKVQQATKSTKISHMTTVAAATTIRHLHHIITTKPLMPFLRTDRRAKERKIKHHEHNLK